MRIPQPLATGKVKAKEAHSFRSHWHSPSKRFQARERMGGTGFVMKVIGRLRDPDRSHRSWQP